MSSKCCLIFIFTLGLVSKMTEFLQCATNFLKHINPRKPNCLLLVSLKKCGMSREIILDAHVLTVGILIEYWFKYLCIWIRVDCKCNWCKVNKWFSLNMWDTLSYFFMLYTVRTANLWVIITGLRIVGKVLP